MTELTPSSTGKSFAYAYDAVGNRNVQTRTITSTTVTPYTYPSTALRAGDTANRLDYFYEYGDQTDLAWDDNGNLAVHCIWTYPF